MENCEANKHDITNTAAAEESTGNPTENGVVMVINHSNVHPPFSVLWTTVLYSAEFICASVLSSMYHKSEDVVWMGLTITFILVPSVLTQLTLTFVHRDLGRDRPLVLFMHLLQMGPIIRCIEALVVYCQAGKREEPYVTISRKIKLKHGRSQGPAFEREIGHSERKLAEHRNAFKRTAFDDFKVRLKPTAYLCMILWRGLEIATRITTLVLFSTAFRVWVVFVGLTNLLIFFFQPWVEFWIRKASLPENVEKNFSKLGTTVVLSMVTFLYACINVFCWSAVQLDLADHDLVEKQPRWRSLAVYYSLRFMENVTLIILWYYFKSDFYEYVCTPLLVVQLIVCYSLAVLFMLLFHQFCHPCRRLFHYNVEDCLRCACCWNKKLIEDQVEDLQVGAPPDLRNHAADRETDIVDEIMEAA
ncbi:hypothetical protein DNTS_031026 [Danionella cerebrum]|uniref:XK-related protein n=1 Tax=Danionella cerebrum TaxID=2873325 RepID=A0A553MUN4_9TELE|nr:hypothetical protein DNTS_031026 [Danionella translucida]